ncbi:MAG: hypothetical protein HRU12_24475 [Phaeodactylibacter sp.]|nr:hypothetical protein [Phaeodactylibacter sp.]
MKVGQTVYLRPDKLADGLTINQGVKTRTVEKVGRKYVYLSMGGKYDMETGLSAGEMHSKYVMYPDKESLELQLEREALERKVRDSIDQHGKCDIDIDKLRKIVAIIEL